MGGPERNPLRRLPPAVLFAVSGAALLVLKTLVVVPASPNVAAPAPPPIIITAAQEAQQVAEFAQRTGIQPTPEDKAALTEQLIENEVLYRRAVELGLDRNDRGIRYRMIEKMRFLDPGDGRADDELYREALRLGLDRDDAVVRRMLVESMRVLLSSLPAQPDEEAGRAYFEHHQDQYLEPPRVTLHHVFLRAVGDAGHIMPRATAVLQSLRGSAHDDPELVSASSGPWRAGSAADSGDLFPLGSRFVAQTQHDLAKMFGVQFAATVMDLPVGVWSGPVASAYGLHLVRIETKQPPQVPAFDAVRGQVLADVRQGQRAERLRGALQSLRQRYGVKVEARGGWVSEE